MSQLVLDRNARLLLQAKAHHLDPVVLLGGNGLTEAVIKEVDRALTAHGLIKVKVPSDDREERTAIFEELADSAPPRLPRSASFWSCSVRFLKRKKPKKLRRLRKLLRLPLVRPAPRPAIIANASRK
jgi:putative YhbY family RNA-binding protein